MHTPVFGTTSTVTSVRVRTGLKCQIYDTETGTKQCSSSGGGATVKGNTQLANVLLLSDIAVYIPSAYVLYQGAAYVTFSLGLQFIRSRRLTSRATVGGW